MDVVADRHHEHPDDHGHHHHAPHPDRPQRWAARLRNHLAPHSHDLSDSVDGVLEGSRDGTRALVVSLFGLGVTAVVELAVSGVSGSAALVGDGVHNVADALTVVPLAVAFWLGRRAATRRHTYGFGRSEDLAGLAIVAIIAVSVVATAAVAISHLVHPLIPRDLGWVACAAMVGVIGNEAVAHYRIRVGRRIGSAALVADGVHARADGLASLAVLAGVGGSALGWHLADAIVGLLITAVIGVALVRTAADILARLMDAVDVEVVDAAHATLAATPGVRGVDDLRLRWLGHHLIAECAVAVDDSLTVVAAHAITADAEHRLVHAVHRLRSATVHAEPVATEPTPSP